VSERAFHDSIAKLLILTVNCLSLFGGRIDVKKRSHAEYAALFAEIVVRTNHQIFNYCNLPIEFAG